MLCFDKESPTECQVYNDASEISRIAPSKIERNSIRLGNYKGSTRVYAS